jgi:hypothetical protein
VSSINQDGVNHQPIPIRQGSTALAHGKGGPRGDRTHNPRIKSPLLCQLS